MNINKEDSKLPVSVIMPCFQCSNTIQKSFDSILCQTILPKEVILIDDASTDSTLSKLESIKKKYNDLISIKVYSLSENGGPATARNMGWNNADQPYLAFLDADDAWHPKKLEIQMQFMTKDPSVVLSGHKWIVIKKKFGPEKIKNIDPKVKSISKTRILFSNCFSTPTVILKRNLNFRFQEKKRYSEDYLLWMEIIMSGYKAIFLPINLTFLFKKAYGENGLSSRLWQMEKEELKNYIYLFRDKKRYLSIAVFFMVVSWFKFIKRIIVCSLRKLQLFSD